VQGLGVDMGARALMFIDIWMSFTGSFSQNICAVAHPSVDTWLQFGA
jgi:hypothetical protein